MKLDLYDLEKLKIRVFDWVDSVKIFNYVNTVGLDEQIFSVIDELKAAREFIAKVQEIENCFDDNVKYDELKFDAICDALRLYEEATK